MLLYLLVMSVRHKLYTAFFMCTRFVVLLGCVFDGAVNVDIQLLYFGKLVIEW